VNRFSKLFGGNAKNRTVSRRPVPIFSLACIIYFIIAGGPFSTEQAIGKSGPGLGLLILLVLPLVWCLPVGLMTAELSSAIPEEGGYYVWVKTALGPFAGFLCAWFSWLAFWVDLALYPLLAVKYVGHLLPGGVVPHSYAWCLLVIAIFTYVNYRGIQLVGRASEILSVVILLPFVPLVGFGIAGMFQHGVPHLPLLNPGVQSSDIGAAVVLGLWNYLGWDSITSASGEISDAGKKLPVAMLIALGMVTAAIVLPVGAAVILEHNWKAWDTDAGYFPQIGAAAWAPLFYAMVVGGTLSNLGQFAGNMLASSRIPYVLAADRYFPGFIFRAHPKYQTPWVALLIAAFMSALFAQERFENLLPVDIALYLAGLLLELAAWVILRRRRVTEKASFHLRLKPWLLGLLVVTPAVVAIAGISLQMQPQLKLADLSEFHVTPPQLLFLMLASGPAMYWICRIGAKFWAAKRS